MTEYKELYPYSRQYAVSCHEIAYWRDSYRENCDCARAIERAIEGNYHDNRLEDGTRGIIERYGFDRVNWVLSNTIQEKDHDGRFSPENRAWARQTYIPEDEVRWHFCVESHPGLTNLFVDQVRRAWQRLGLFDQSQCTGEKDYEGKLLVLKPSMLKDEYKSPDYQLFYAEGGFGCSPNARGRKVFGFFLKDGDRTNYNRADFLGVIDEAYLPDWARENLAEVTEQGECESITMGGK